MSKTSGNDATVGIDPGDPDGSITVVAAYDADTGIYSTLWTGRPPESDGPPAVEAAGCYASCAPGLAVLDAAFKPPQ